MTEFKIPAITFFENYDLEKMEDGHVLLTTEVVASSLNIYGKAHGGYLFGLCDNVAGLTVFSMGSHCVTLQSSINYLRAAELGERLTLEGHCVHDGLSTKLVDVTIRNQANQLVCQASFTMFVTGKMEHLSDLLGKEQS